MAVFGKIVGGVIGSMGGPIGIALGVVLGHKLDTMVAEKSAEGTKEVAFMFVLVACMAKMAKADGHVSQHEVARAGALFKRLGLTGNSLELAKKIFQREKDSDTDIGDYFDQFRKITQGDPTQAQLLYGMIADIAKSDDKLHAREVEILRLAEVKLGLPAGFTDNMLDGEHKDRKVAAETLGISPNATEAEIKKAYRKKCSEMHPDILASKGLPEELMSFAGTQIHLFTEARDTLMK